jgi:hypothetical protein
MRFVVLLALLQPPANPPTNLADWTPRPATGKAEPWEKMRDPQWDDARFLKSDTGPSFHATFRYKHNGKDELVYKGLAIKLDGGGAIFDRASCTWACGWLGGYLVHSPRRFALLNTPTPDAKTLFANEPSRATIPAGASKFRGHYRRGDRIIVHFTDGQNERYETVRRQGNSLIRSEAGGGKVAVTVRGEPIADARPDDFQALMSSVPRATGEPIVTKLLRGNGDGPFRVDTLTVPYDNALKALFFLTSLAPLPDGRIAVTTCHGDVWTVAIDETKGECRWRRFASGLYHPFGLKIVDDKLIVLERGQLTRLHDTNGDGEADFYENLCNAWHTGNGEHSYDTGLETDPAGNFYFFKTGDTHLPSGGTLIKVSKDGSKVETFATGFRHPIGLGMSKSGIVTGADQEGNWMPATRIDEYKPGGFYGDMRAHHRTTPPTTYDGPLCWLPREVDNSAGGQVWVPETATAWGPLAGKPLHLSYGRCKAFTLLRQTLPDGRVQGGVCDLGFTFLAGSCRGRFTDDGTLYVVGLNGWQTAAKADGSLQRVVPTGKPYDGVVESRVTPTGLRLTFSRPIDATSIAPDRFKSAAWNYRWSGDYGSKRWRPSNPNAEGQDDRKVMSAKRLDDRTVELQFAGGLPPVMQQQVGYSIKATDGTTVQGSVYLTIHGTGP